MVLPTLYPISELALDGIQTKVLCWLFLEYIYKDFVKFDYMSAETLPLKKSLGLANNILQ